MSELDEWTGVRKRSAVVEARRVEESQWMETPWGTMHAIPGDVLIRGVNGEVYPVPPDEFERAYEIVE